MIVRYSPLYPTAPFNLMCRSSIYPSSVDIHVNETAPIACTSRTQTTDTPGIQTAAEAMHNVEGVAVDAGHPSRNAEEAVKTYYSSEGQATSPSNLRSHRFFSQAALIENRAPLPNNNNLHISSRTHFIGFKVVILLPEGRHLQPSQKPHPVYLYRNPLGI